MKKKLTHLIAICLSFLMMATVLPSVLLGMPETKTASAAEGEGNNATIGVSLPSDQDEMGTLSGLMQTMFAGYSADILIANNNATNQVDQLWNFIAANVGVIVVMPVDEVALVDVINEATVEGIFVIVIGQNHGLYNSVVYVDFDYSAKAEAQVDDYVENHMDQSESKTFLIIACNNGHGELYYNSIVNRILSYRDNGTNIDYKVLWINSNITARSLADQIGYWIENNNGGRLSDAIYCCCYGCKTITIEALTLLGYTFGPDGIPIYVGNSGSSGDYEKLVALILDLINKKMNNEEIEGDTFLVEI